MVATEGSYQRPRDRSPSQEGLESLLGLDDFAPPVVAAVTADSMRQLGFAAIRADGAGRRGKSVMGAPTVAPGLRVSSFWICHGEYYLP